MHTINHYTLNTGNLRVSYPEEVNKDLFFILKKYINKAKRGKTQLLDGTYMYIIEEEDCYVCTLYGKRGNDFVPIISTSGTKDESARTYVWEQMEHMGQSRVARRLYDASVRNCAIYRGLCSYHISLFLRCINMDRRFCQVLGMDDAFPRGGKRKIMINEDIKALMRKYNVQPHGDQLRLQKILDWDDGEVGKLKEAKPEILQYFKDKEEEKRRQEEETLSKARAGKDGLFLIIDEELGYGIHVGAARWLTEEEKPQYSEWFKEIGMVGAGASTTLDRLTFEDMPRRETDGSLLSSSARVWIISPEEYDRYIALNEERERKVKEQEAEEERLREEKRAAAQQEKEALLAKVNTWDISSRTITDEGGRTQVHTHIFQVGDDKLVFTERNVFDFGVVINPAYQVAEDVEAGGIALEIDGVLQWHTFGKDMGWIPVRPLTENEKICHEIIAKYGKYAGWNTRM